MIGQRRVYPVARWTRPFTIEEATAAKRSVYFVDPDVAFDTYDADTGELVKRGQTPRELHPEDYR